MNEAEEKARADFATASKQLWENICKDKGVRGKSCEEQYNKTYQRLVALGLEPKLRRKYCV
jgi:hypothetical protein